MSRSPNTCWPNLESPLVLPKILEFNLRHNASFPAFVYPEQETGNLVTISMLEYIRASYRVGSSVLGTSNPGDVVAIIANLDNIVYMALINGLINIGLVPFPISPRNAAPAIVNLLRDSSAHRILTTYSTLKGLIDEIRSEIETNGPFELSIEEAPDLQEVYPYLGKEKADDPFCASPQPYYPNDAEIALYMHSSGSTRFPKAIRLSHTNFKDYISVFYMQDMRDLGFAPLGAAGLPPFHIFAILNQGYVPLYGLVTVSMFTPTVTRADALPMALSPQNVLENSRLTKANALMTVPAFLHLWSHSEEAVNQLAEKIVVIYGGGPLPKTTGDHLVSRGVKICTGYGGTEFGIVTRAIFSPEDWSYVQLVDRVNVRWLAQGDGSFEAQFLTHDKHHPAIENLPELKGYATSDLLVPHPTDLRKWKIVGRLDDVIIHSSGEKTIPGPMETIITATPLLYGAVMFGRERSQTGILVEPSPNEKVDVTDPVQVAAFRNSLWPLVDEANMIAPVFSRIFKEMILITSPDKPLPRVGKGTVARKAALALYEQEINELYSIVELNGREESVDQPRAWTVENIQSWLDMQVAEILSGGRHIHLDRDLFEQGFDSIMATILRLRIVNALRKANRLASAREVTQGLVYTYPSINSLTKAILEIYNPSSDSSAKNTHTKLIEEMIEKYSQGLDVPPPCPKIPFNNENHHVLLTGSTGNIGAELLVGLVLTDSVHRVYALNRPSSSGLSIIDRHRARFEDKGLDDSILYSPKIVFLESEIFDDHLGVPQGVLHELQQNLTIIIHNAWRLDFNLSLSSFELHIRGARSLIDLARSSRQSSNIRFLFTSSIASTQSWDVSKGSYPEEIVLDAKYALGSGYGESKYITERILAKSGLQTTSFRIGQVAGGEPNGAWATSDWFPILVKSSLTLNKLPDARGFVSWVPMDAVTQALLDTAFLENSAPIAVNILHPNPTSWSTVIQKIRRALIHEKNLPSDALPLIPIQQWVSDIEKHANNPSDNLPALKLLDFFRTQAKADDPSNTCESMRLTPLKIENVKRISLRMRNLQAFDASIVDKWVKYWIRSGM
ncbi:hypothetical protein GYMLUDRAFT_94733 [Collybiopsis luxurians FD-317 M1]|nr:hypothetical protein GYMLUDRAFT_94733 [Collybiopsis luxurians FD-317 M1]